MSDFDTSFGSTFADLRSQASAAVDAAVPAPETQVETPVEQPVVETPVEGQAPVQPQSPPPAQVDADELDPELHGDRKVRVKIDGEWQTVTLKEAANGYSRTSNYTKSKQQLAAERAELEAQKTQRDRDQQELQQTRAFLNNPQLVAQYLRQTMPQLFQPQPEQQPVGQPHEIATIEQADRLIESRIKGVLEQLQQVEQQTAKRIADATAQIQHRAETGKYIEQLQTTVSKVFEQYPILEAMPNAEDNIRYEVAKLKPKTIEEAKEAFAQVAQGFAENLEAKWAALNKSKLAKADKLKTSRIEPPGGSGPQLQPANLKNTDGSVNWKSLTEMAKNYAEKAS